ncbi:MAG: HI0074 family nucleotidyltransferase substrate-binding subunit [Eubacteriales bacterium]
MNKIIQEIRKICKNCPDLSKAVLFGSRGRGTHQPTSDFDLALYLNENSPSKTKMTLLHLLDEVDCLQKIDVLFVTEKTDGKLLENIEKEGVVLMERSSKKANFVRAVKRLEEAVKLCEENPCDFYFDALIQRFEFSTELAWKSCKEHLRDLGYTEVNGPKPVMREAFTAGLIEEDEIWISILSDRNLTSHIYDEETAREIAGRVMGDYLESFRKLMERLCEE